MHDLKNDFDVPLPADAEDKLWFRRGRLRRHLREMPVMASVFVPCMGEYWEKRVRLMVYQVKAEGIVKDFIVRGAYEKLDDGRLVPGLRIWRIEDRTAGDVMRHMRRKFPR